MSLAEFLRSPFPNQWISFGMGLEIYVRKNHLYKDRVDLANFNNPNPGRGSLTHFLPIIENELKEHGYQTVFVENVINKRLGNFLSRNGYKKLPCRNSYQESMPCYEKHLKGDESCVTSPKA